MMFPSFILSMLILTTRNCHIKPTHTWSLHLVLFIQCAYFLDLTYLRMKKLIDNITIFHDHFLSISMCVELLIILWSILIFFYVDYKNRLTSLDQALIWIFFANWLLTIPFSFPWLYHRYYYKSIHSTNALISRWSIFYRITVHNKENIMNRVYSILHVACHHSNSYDIMYSINCPSIPLLNHAPSKLWQDDDKKDELLPETPTTHIALTNFTGKYGIVKHTQFGAESFLCLQYQTAFMRLSIKEKVDYICEIAPYQSPWWRKPIWYKPTFTLVGYLYLFARVCGGLFPHFWFIYIYMYAVNGDLIKDNGINQWFKDSENKYEHIVIVFLLCVWCIVTVIWAFCATKILTCEFYYGFIRALLINDDTLFLGVDKFHEWMLRSFEIITFLEQEHTVTHIAIEIVSYLPQQ